MLVNNEVTSKLAITTLSELMSLFKSSWTKEKESLITRELADSGVRKGIKNLAMIYLYGSGFFGLYFHDTHNTVRQ